MSLLGDAPDGEALALQSSSHFSSFVALQSSVVCPVFESITVFAGKQLQVTVLAFSCLSTTQCSISSAVGGGTWLRIGCGVAATGCFFAAQPARSRQNTSQAFLMPLFSLARAHLSMAILVTCPESGCPPRDGNRHLSDSGRRLLPRLIATFGSEGGDVTRAGRCHITLHRVKRACKLATQFCFTWMEWLKPRTIRESLGTTFPTCNAAKLFPNHCSSITVRPITVRQISVRQNEVRRVSGFAERPSRIAIGELLQPPPARARDFHRSLTWT